MWKLVISLAFKKPKPIVNNMKKSLFIVLLMSAAALSQAAPDKPAMLRGNVSLKSATSILFNKDGILFIADPLAKHIFALDLKESGTTRAAEINASNIDERLGALLGVSAKDVVINDMAVSPKTGNIVLAVSRKGSSPATMLVVVDQKAQLSLISLDNVDYYQTDLTDVPEKGSAKAPRWYSENLAVTDMAFVDGELFVAGLSGEEFSSKLRRFKYPFDKQGGSTKVEFFHTSHDKYETTSPIETFMEFKVNGQTHLLAAYGCSPVAKYPLNDVRSNAQLRGTTILEIGGGNRPLDMLTYRKNDKDYILIANSSRTLIRMNSDDVDKATPLTTVVNQGYQHAGVNYLSIAEVGIMQLDKLNDQYLIMVQRDVEDGSLNLRTMKIWF